MTIELTQYTVASAQAEVNIWDDLPLTRRRDLRSALSHLATRAGLPSEACSLDISTVRRHIGARESAELGVKDGRKYNVKNGIRYVMQRLGLVDGTGPDPSPIWNELLGDLDARARGGLSAFASFCSGRQIEPSAVDVDVLKQFMTWLEERTITPQPRKRAGDVRTIWNKAAKTRPAWPGDPLPELLDERQYVLPLAAFSEPFQRDLRRFGERMAGGGADPFAGDDDTPLPKLTRALRPTTIALRQDHARWGASALAATGFQMENIISLATLVEPANVRAILRYLHDRAGGKASPAGMHVAEALHIIAAHHAPVGPEALQRIKAFKKMMTVPYHAMTQKNERTVRAAIEPRRELALLHLPARLMRAARASRETNPREAAGLAWRALAVGLLTVLPLRLANVIGLRLDKHLFRPDPAKRHIEAIMIGAEETKTGRPMHASVSPDLNRLINEYITTFRPAIAPPGCQWLFPGDGTGDRPLTPQSFRDAIKKVTARYAGVVISPHQFRHVAAKRFLEEAPGQYGVVAQILGHASEETGRRSYRGTETDAALKRFDQIVTRRRETLRRTKPPARRTSAANTKAAQRKKAR